MIWTTMTQGGHFAAMEQPALLATDICGFSPPAALFVLNALAIAKILVQAVRAPSFAVAPVAI